MSTVSRLSVVLAGAVLLMAVPKQSFCADAGFEHLLRTGIRGTFDSITSYVHEHPDADDVESAWRWLFVTALDHRFEQDAIELAIEYQRRPETNPVTKNLAEQTLILGLASSGRAEESVEKFSGLLRLARFQSGGELIEFGKRLATQLCMARDFDAARAVYEQIATKFFLNADVRALCENRIDRIRLVDQPAPEVSATTVAGEPISLSDLQGKVVLVDFWATNCPPCIEELPNIRHLYQKYRDQGFEVIGISLDGDDSIVREFTGRMRMEWPQIVDTGAVASLRERYGVRTIPALFIVDRAGKLSQFDVRGADLRATIESLLQQQQ